MPSAPAVEANNTLTTFPTTPENNTLTTFPPTPALLSQVDIGPHTYLLSPGDHFFVPHNCEYRLMNFSETPSEVAFVVIKPQPTNEGAGGGEGAAQ